MIIPSIDARYPLGRCKTNGKVALTSDEAEANRLAGEYRLQMERERGR